MTSSNRYRAQDATYRAAIKWGPDYLSLVLQVIGSYMYIYRVIIHIVIIQQTEYTSKNVSTTVFFNLFSVTLCPSYTYLLYILYIYIYIYNRKITQMTSSNWARDQLQNVDQITYLKIWPPNWCICITKE